ncbi:MAG: DUF1592 domain-containing protein [Verrucomicrobiales bacterium]|nr:DUF1592 domain-containing protein [Verrucomicrobiales bacterium]
MSFRQKFPVLSAAVSLLSLSCSLGVEDEMGEFLIGVFREHCVSCHGENGKVKGKVDLLKIDDAGTLLKHPELLEELVAVIDFEEMPPEDEPQMKPEERKELLAQLEALLEQSVSEGTTFTHTPIRRMNRFQYNNAVIDLFDLKCIVFTLPERMMREHKGYFRPETGKMAETVTVGSRPLGKSQMIEPRLMGVAAFPQDLRAEHGYDNQADHLSLSPLLMEEFLKLGQSITGSKDFVAKNVGVWDTFFQPPGREAEINSLVRDRLRPFLRKAFRRPVDDQVLDRYAGYVVSRVKAGDEFTSSMKSIAAAVISSPKFLYLYDKTSGREVTEPVDEFELASRLSFFLWGSLPDDRLLDLASSGELGAREVLSQEIDRMFSDRKLKRFCDSFPAQWLQLERIISSVPDPHEYPDFYFSKYRDSMHMMLEPLLLFEAVLIENQPITQFIDSDFTYRSGLLEEAYGELETKSNPAQVVGDGVNRGGVAALRFDRVPVTDRRNGGLITNAAVMTMTSGPERTQPITRGAWLATVIFNNPPSPPPADVPALGEKPDEGEEHLTLRERLSKHRERADCKGCHEQIDPLGFALENYDPIGNWRSIYENERDVDMEGTLFRKHRFSSVPAFKDAILAEKDRFSRGLAGHLLSFALARELGPADQIALDLISERTADQDYRFQSLLREIILSEPFQTKTTPASEPAIAATQ